MKTLKTLLVITALSGALSVVAGDVTQDPNLVAGQQLGKKTANVVLANPAAGYQDPNLISQQFGGKRTADAKVTAGPAAKEEDTLTGTKCRGMASKQKDTPACAQHCAKMAKQ
jgi:hypothetical protein